MKILSKLLLILLVSVLTAHVRINGQQGLISSEEPLFQSSLITPVFIRQTGKNNYFADFGKDAFGTLILRIKPEKNETLTVRLGEKTSAPLRIDRNPGGTIRYMEIKLQVTPSVTEYVVELPPDKRNTNPPAVALPDSFGVIMPFRYCEIEDISVPLTAESVRQKVYHYKFDETSSSFTSSDTVLNKIWDLCKYSIKATSFCGYYVDGDRERIPYEADAYINQLSHYSVDNEYTLARRTNEYFILNPTWPTEWQLYTVLLFYNDYMYTGDITSIMANYEALRVKTLSGLARSDGLITTKSDKLTDEFMSKLGFKDNKQRIRDIVDWPPAQKDTGWKLATPEGERDGYELVPVNTVVNSLYYANLRLMSEIAGWIGRKEDAKEYESEAVRVRDAINRVLLDRNKGFYVDGENSSHSSLHANMFPLAFGLVPEENISSVIELIKSRGMACSVYGSQILLDGLYSVNEAEYALQLLTSTSDRSWWNMIRSGSTITLEAWDMKYKPNSDWNHAWGAAPANIITRQMWGIRPLEPGFRKALIKPQLGNLTSSSIRVPTIRGALTASYSLPGDESKLFTVEIPSNMEAEFILAPEDLKSARINKRKIKQTDGTIKLKPGKYTIEIGL